MFDNGFAGHIFTAMSLTTIHVKRSLISINYKSGKQTCFSTTLNQI